MEESRGYTAYDNMENFPATAAYAACDAALIVRNHKKHYRQAAVKAASRSARTLPCVSCTFSCRVYFLYVNLCFLSHLLLYLMFNNNKKSHRPFQD
jgi:hypothetical protein